MKKARATMPRDSRHVRPGCRLAAIPQAMVSKGSVVPMAMILDANCQVAALHSCQKYVLGLKGHAHAHLNASETQYEMKLVTPHFRACRGTGSRSLFVLHVSPSAYTVLSTLQPMQCLPSRISLGKRRFGLLHPQGEVWLLNDGHCV